MAKSKEEKKAPDKPAGKPFTTIKPMEEDLVYHPNGLVYGHTGVGKTGLAATAEKSLILDFENGAVVTVRAVGNPDTEVVPISSMKEVRAIYQYLLNEEHDYKTVVMDPLGDLQKMMMLETIEKYPSKRNFERVPNQQDWGLMTEDFQRLLNAFRALPMYTLFVAHATSRSKEEDVVMPLLQGKQMLSLAVRSVDLLGYMYVEMEGQKPVRKLLTSSTPTIAAKNRGGKLPRVVTSPNMAEVFRQMLEGDSIPEDEEDTDLPGLGSAPDPDDIKEEAEDTGDDE